MLHTENRIVIHAPASLVYGLASDVARWPDILPHYRRVRVLEENERRRTVLMSASRSGIPVSWTSTQELRPDDHEVVYHHVAGVTRGMEVIWRITAKPGGVIVTIDHDLNPSRWWLRPRLSRYVVGTLFVMHIADRTLQGVKRRAEAMHLEHATT